MKNTPKPLVLTSLSALALVFNPALASNDAPASNNETSMEHFVRIDTNQDGQLSHDELKADGSESRFELLDRNNDQAISKAEWDNQPDHDNDGE